MVHGHSVNEEAMWIDMARDSPFLRLDRQGSGMRQLGVRGEEAQTDMTKQTMTNQTTTKRPWVPMKDRQWPERR